MNIGSLRAKSDVLSDVVYDKDYGVRFKLKYVDKTTMTKLNGQFTEVKFNPRSHQKEEELNVEGLRKRICEIGVVGWEGVTPRWLSTVMPIDVEEVEDLDEPIEFNQKNLNELCDVAYGLDAWIFENVRNGENFNKNIKKVEDELKN